MKIESLIRIIGGVLQNTPSIFQVDRFFLNPTKITRGSVFFDINDSVEDVNLALEHGAYAIISRTIYPIMDEEIAWIHIEDLEKALLKLSRFFVQEKQIKILQLPKIYFALLCFFRLHVKTKILKSSIENAFVQIESAEEKAIFLTKLSEETKLISAQNEIDIKKNVPEKIFEKSLFISSFIYKEKFIQDLRLSSFFIPYLCGLFDFLVKNSITYEMNPHAEFSHFQAQFVDEKLRAKEFGNSSKVLIFENDKDLLLQEIVFLEECKYKDATIFCNFSKEKLKTQLKTFDFSDIHELEKIEKENFRYALVYAKKEDFETMLYKQNHQQLTLL